MKLSFSAVPSPLLAGFAGCALLLALGQGILSRLFHGDPDARQELELKPGESTHGTLDLSRADEIVYRVEVSDSSLLLRVKLECRETDLELSARAGDTDDDQDPDFRLTTEDGTGTISFTRFTEPPIAAGRYQVRVAWRSPSPPRTADRKLEKIPFTIRADVFAARVDGTLSPGVMSSATIEPDTGGFRTFMVDVPAGARALRFDIAEAQSDLDLFAERGQSVRKLSEEVYFVQHNYGRETLVIDSTSTPPLEPGTWYVDVLDIQDDERPTTFKLLATFDARAPAELLAIPTLVKTPAPAGADAGSAPPAHGAGTGGNVLARALGAVVEISTDSGAGSGTVLTRDGWILTNAHVVTGLGGEVLKELVISVPLDPRQPCVEMFRARVDRVDKQRDLALVQVSSGFYGQALPADYDFPTVELGEPDALAIGDPLWLVGYPSTGGQGSRVTITATRGVVSGFDTVAFGTVLKSDATITLGNSGGAALDARGRFVGVPTSTIELGSGHIAYIHPLTALPADWRATIDASLARNK
jgi:S1-C subfamily serine protease